MQSLCAEKKVIGPRKRRDCSTLQSIAKAKPFRGRRAWTGFLDPFIVLRLLTPRLSPQRFLVHEKDRATA